MTDADDSRRQTDDRPIDELTDVRRDGRRRDDDACRRRRPRDLLIQEGDIAADYLERLLDIVDYDGDIDLDVENDRAVVAIIGTGPAGAGRHRAARRSTRCRSSPGWRSRRRPAPAAG